MYKFKEYLMLVVLVIGGVFSVFNLIPLPEVVEDNKWVKDYVQISAHRGGAYLNPENTQKAFDYVIKETSYTDIVEIDVRLTKDNILVINHDGDINRMGTSENEEEIKISAHTYEELSNYNLGKNFVDLNGNKPYYDLSIDEARQEGLTLMRFEDFLIRYNDYENVKVFIEIKDSGDGAITVADMIISMLDKYSSYKNRSMIISFDDEVLDYIYKTYPNQYTGALGDKVISQIALNKLCLDAFSSPNYHSIQVPYNDKAKKVPLNLHGKAMINAFKEMNQLVVYWGINNKEDMIKLIDAGTHVITTDRPDLLADILKR